MKKLFSKFLIATLLVTCSTGVQRANASTNDEIIDKKGEIIYFDQDEEVKRVQDEIMRERSLKRSADEEVWTISKTEYLKTNVLLTANVEPLIGKGQSQSNGINLTLGANKVIHGYTVNIGFTFTSSYSTSGPGNSDALAKNSSNGYLTHYVPVGYTKGDLVRYTYRITSRYDGSYLRTETRNVALRKEGGTYIIGAQSSSNFKAENTVGNNYKTYTNYSDYANKIRSLNSSYLYF